MVLGLLPMELRRRINAWGLGRCGSLGPSQLIKLNKSKASYISSVTIGTKMDVVGSRDCTNFGSSNEPGMMVVLSTPTFPMAKL